MNENQEMNELEYIDLNPKGSERSHKPKYNKGVLILCACFVIGAIIAGAMWVAQKVNRNHAEEQLEQLAENTGITVENEEPYIEDIVTVETAETNVVQEPEIDPIEQLKEMGVPIPEKTVDFADLQANTNSDIYAWIYIPDSKIDYPIVQHPEDNYYYLNYNLDGSKGYPGCIYTEDYNTKDFSDPNTVIYGHNMKNGTMFAGLHNFEDIEYFDANRYVYVYTPDELLVYEVFAAYEASSEHILYNHDFTDEIEYQLYLEDIYEKRTMNCNLRDDVEVTPEDRIITLSTCIANKPKNRYLVQGVLLNEN